MKIKNLVVFVIAAAAGCSGVNQPGSASGGAGGPADGGSGATGTGSGAGSGSGAGTGSGSALPPDAWIGSVYDERNDQIDFTTGEPVHTHVGPRVDLSSGQTSCPKVSRYAYLMDPQSPTFGRQTTTNPWSWKLRTDLTDLDDSATAYRVRDANGAVLLDWTPVSAANGVYEVSLYRGGAHPIPKLGTEAGELHLEMRLRTTGGAESLVSTCWTNAPLATPLAFGAVQPGALFGMSLPANSPISPLINAASVTDNPGIEVAAFTLTQQTAEATPVSITLPPHGGRATGETLSIYLQYFGGPDGRVCDSPDTGPCANSYATNITRVPVSAPLSGTWILRVLDDQGADLCHWTSGTFGGQGVRCVIPARGVGELPRVYRVALSLAGEETLAPYAPEIGTTTFAEHVLGATRFTGSFDGSISYVGCGQVISAGSGTHLAYKCAYDNTYYLSRVLDTARIDFEPIVFALTTGDDEIAPPYIDPALLRLASRTWDGGTEGL